MELDPKDFSDKPIDVPLETALVFDKRGGVSYTNVPHLLVQHSPDGFSFGYRGSGPSDMALNYCEWYLRHIGYDGQRMNTYIGDCFLLASHLHQDFKEKFLTLDVTGSSIPYFVVKAWFDEQLTPKLLKTYERWEDED